MTRGAFVFRMVGAPETRFELAASEWSLFRRLRLISEEGGQLLYFESHGAPLVPRSLAALNAYLETKAIRYWKSRRWDEGRELLGGPEWRRFAKMLALKFDGRGTRRAA